jgi:putative tryptophan/tyrosine transport system substrate-binding protein
MRHRQLIAELARVHRLPAVYPLQHYAAVGGMVTYGPDDGDLDLRLAAIVDAILQGGKPGDIPFYQPTRYQLFINLKSARDIGLDIPSALLTAADEVTESVP